MIAHAAAADVAREFLDRFNEAIMYPLITLMMAVALIVFLYGMFLFIANAANESRRSEGKRHMLWGIIGLVVMVSAYGILSIAAGTFGL